MMPEEEPNKEMIDWGAREIRLAVHSGKMSDLRTVAAQVWRTMSKFRSPIQDADGTSIESIGAVDGGDAHPVEGGREGLRARDGQ